MDPRLCHNFFSFGGFSNNLRILLRMRADNGFLFFYENGTSLSYLSIHQECPISWMMRVENLRGSMTISHLFKVKWSSYVFSLLVSYKQPWHLSFWCLCLNEDWFRYNGLVIIRFRSSYNFIPWCHVLHALIYSK